MLQYKISATAEKGGAASATANKSAIAFDASAGRDANLPNPAEMLLSALAACILKNVERYSGILHYPYKSAKVTVTGERSDSPPVMKRIDYLLEIDTDIDERKLKNWHKNIVKFGTISNTIANACELNGAIRYINHLKSK